MKDPNTEAHTHGGTHTQTGYTLEGTNIRRDIQTEGAFTGRGHTH